MLLPLEAEMRVSNNGVNSSYITCVLCLVFPVIAQQYNGNFVMMHLK